MKGSLTPGTFQAFFQYMNMSSEPITELSYMTNPLQSALASMERVYELLDENPSVSLSINTLLCMRIPHI